MKHAARIGDIAKWGTERSGPAVQASADVIINDRRAVRIGDHGVTRQGSRWRAVAGAPCVLINNKLAHRTTDKTDVDRRTGHTCDGSSNVIIGDWKTSDDGRWTWIDIELRDGDGNPVPDHEYVLALSDGSLRTGRLDDEGKAHHEWLVKGGGEVCEIRFSGLTTHTIKKV